MATDWWWIVPAAQVDAATRPSDAVLYSVAAGSANDSALLGLNTITYHGKPYGRFQGPFTTEAAAKAAPAGGASGAEVIGAGLGAGAAATALPGDATAAGAASAAGAGAAATVTGWEQALENFLSSLTDMNTWIRVSKVVIGGVLLIVGLVHITGADNAIATAARKVPLPV